MSKPTLSEMVQSLQDEVTTLRVQMATQQQASATHSQLTQEVTALKEQVAQLVKEVDKLRDTTKAIPVVEHQIADLAKVKESWGHRAWFIVTITLSAFFATLTAILGALLTFTLNAKK